uniref:Putative secreted protein n=1 Tax=Anopheles darlingi TaxID=43151 RepID=A0A2M4DIW4_ANODA
METPGVLLFASGSSCCRGGDEPYRVSGTSGTESRVCTFPGHTYTLLGETHIRYQQEVGFLERGWWLD